MKRFIFDTETTGTIKKKLPWQHPDQPRVVQVAGILVNSHWMELNSFSFVVKPQGFEIPDEAAAIHGITTPIAELIGLPLLTVLSAFNQMVYLAQEVWAYNAAFDVQIMRSEFNLAGRPYSMDGRTARCAMLAAKDVLKLPGRYNDYKWPNLAEAYAYLCEGAINEKAHDALADVRATAKVMQAMETREAFQTLILNTHK